MSFTPTPMPGSEPSAAGVTEGEGPPIRADEPVTAAVGGGNDAHNVVDRVPDPGQRTKVLGISESVD